MCGGRYREVPLEGAVPQYPVRRGEVRRGDGAQVPGRRPLQAARGTTGNTRDRTPSASGTAGTGIKPANTHRTALIAWTAKTGRIDAENMAQVPGTGMVPERCVPTGHARGMRAMAGQGAGMARDRTRVASRARSLPGRHDAKIDAPVMHSERALGQPESAGPGPGHDGSVLGRRARQAGHLTVEISVTGGSPGRGPPTAATRGCRSA